MTQVSGIPYRRHGPTAALRQFLDPLDPGDYFDCGRARLHGLDDALLAEARARGRTIGDDAFLLVATDMGLIFCRPSISFAIAARWEDITLIRPRGDDPVVLPVTWPRHGELKFTLSKRLAGNIFRRWLQLRMQAARRARDVETGQHRLFAPYEAGAATGPPAGATGPSPAADDRAEGDAVVGPVEEGPTAPRSAPDPSTVDHRANANGESTVDHRAMANGESTVDDRATAVDRSAVDDRSEEAAPTPADEGADRPSTSEADRTDPVTDGLVDGELERVTVPRDGLTTPSWVGSAVSVAATLVVLSTLVLIGAVSVSLSRGVLDPGPGSGVETAEVSQTTVDHRRFRPSSDPGGNLDPDAEPDTGSDPGPDLAAGADPEPLGPSAPGGASQSVPSSHQQLLALPTGSADPDQARRCSSNYGGCVPDVSDLDGADVDCPGQGDGPYYAEGEVVVLGPDLYGLDTDGDGVACEPDQAADVGQPSVPVDPDDPLAPVEGAEGTVAP